MNQDVMNFTGWRNPAIESVDCFEGVQVDVLRLDQVHPLISGNKWYKLKGYLELAGKQKKSAIITFGGAYSNHVIATAAAAKEAGLQSAAIIRGERPQNLSHTLVLAESLGMKLFFTSRQDYRSKKLPRQLSEYFTMDEMLLVPEGGYGMPGALGAATILQEPDTRAYDFIMAATGTGTMLAGLIMASTEKTRIMGISVLKNHFSIREEINKLLPSEKKDRFDIRHGYDWGGYARQKPGLIRFMNHFYRQTAIPTDFVYTGKLFYALSDLVLQKYYPYGTRLLVIHSGGLQGNLSLPKGTLIF